MFGKNEKRFSTDLIKKKLSILMIVLFTSLLGCHIKIQQTSNVYDSSTMKFFYKFEETSPPYVNDYSGNANNGFIMGSKITLNSDSYTTSQGKCYDFTLNSSTPYSYININNTDAIYNSHESFSVTGWIKAVSNQSYQTILAKGRNANLNRSFFIFYHNNRRIYFYTYYNGTNANTLYSSVTLTNGQWYFFACTWQFVTSGTSIMKIYIDGVVTASRTNCQGPVFQTTHSLMIGAFLNSSNAPGYIFRQYLDNLAFYNKVLSDIEIYNIYLSQKG